MSSYEVFIHGRTPEGTDIAWSTRVSSDADEADAKAKAVAKFSGEHAGATPAVVFAAPVD